MRLLCSLSFTLEPLFFSVGIGTVTGRSPHKGHTMLSFTPEYVFGTPHCRHILSPHPETPHLLHSEAGDKYVSM